MATKKQRRRREKDRRHDYEFVYYDEEGNEVEVEAPKSVEKAPAARKPAARAAARNGRVRSVKAPKPPSWRTVGRYGVLIFALLFLFSSLLIRAPKHLLLGASVLPKTPTSVPAGTAIAYKTTAVTKGDGSSLSVYVDSGSGATRLLAGLYADRGGSPGKLLAQASLKPSAGKWNSVGIPSKTAKVVAGRPYWLALLGRGGKLVLRNTGLPAVARTTSGAAALPASWSGAEALTAGLPAAYVARTGSVSIGQRLLLPLIYTLILMPSIYLMQRVTYRTYQKRTGQLQRPKKKG
ncbi:MAG: hypothetical protein ACXVY3_05245 [Gaiellaceae bacterium]